jgi:TRAP-type transport system periplasmic protein
MPAHHGIGTRKVVAGAIAAAVAAWLGAGAAQPASAQAVTLRLHTHVPPVSSSFKNLKAWAVEVTKASGGNIKITAFGSNQLGGKAADIYDQVSQGVVDIGWTLPGYLPGRFPRVSVFELPFVSGAPSYAAPALMEFYGKWLTKEFGDTHVLVLHIGGPFVLHSKSKPIRTLDDLKGLKVRTSSRLTSDIVKALGGTPVAIPGINIAEEMIRGVIDAALVPWNISLAIHLVDEAKAHTEANLTHPVLALMMNKASYAKLSAANKAAIDKESGIAMAKVFGVKWQHDDLPGQAKAKKLKHTIVEIAGAEEARWKKATESVVENWIKTRDAAGDPGRELVNDAKALVAKYKAEIMK